MIHGMGIPAGEEAAREGRHLLQRMVDYLLSQGVRQFLDLGSGLPNMANTHQIARRVDPDTRVVYVDRDPLVSSHAAALMAGHNVLTLRADLREPEQVLDNSEVRSLIDFDQPVAVHVHSACCTASGRRRPVGHRRQVPRFGRARQLPRDEPHDQRDYPMRQRSCSR
jgi:hypothetical protein